jgi:peptide chain release factor subunit 1
MGIIDTLLLSEDLRKYRLKMKCQACDYTENQIVDEETLNDFSPPTCSKCNTSIQMEIYEKIDLIDEFSDIAEKIGAKVHLISRNSEEGDSLYRAFSGLAGVLRYPVDI